MTYNPASINYINYKFSDMMIEDTSQKKSLMYQERTYFSVLLLSYGEPHNFK